MKINLSEKELKLLDNLFKIDEQNKVIADFIMFYIDNAKDIKKPDIFNQMISQFQLDKKFVKLLKDYNLDKNIKKLDVNEYKNNDYFKNIKLDNICKGDYKFKLEKFNPYEGFLCESIKTIDINKEITSLGYFEKEYEYITLSYKDNIWMLISPHEINTMKKSIQEASGNVITFGLGLGYYAYMISNKEEVKSVTIIEKDENIIELFNRYIYPQFKNKEKIKIINEDALKYINIKPFPYDYAFVDLWRDVDDGLQLYVKMLKKSFALKTKFSFWIEESMLIMLRRCLITLLYEKVNDICCEDIDSYYDVMIAKFDNILKEYNINSFEDIKVLLSNETIYKLLKKS